MVTSYAHDTRLFCFRYLRRSLLFFFFQAEDGIRHADVTGVQPCALPIYVCRPVPAGQVRGSDPGRACSGDVRRGGGLGPTPPLRHESKQSPTEVIMAAKRPDFRRLCAGEDLNLHDLLRSLGPQPSASTNSATSA